MMRCSDFRRDDHWIELREKHTQSDRPRLETAEIGPSRIAHDGRSQAISTSEQIVPDPGSSRGWLPQCPLSEVEQRRRANRYATDHHRPSTSAFSASRRGHFRRRQAGVPIYLGVLHRKYTEVPFPGDAKPTYAISRIEHAEAGRRRHVCWSCADSHLVDQGVDHRIDDLLPGSRAPSRSAYHVRCPPSPKSARRTSCGPQAVAALREPRCANHAREVRSFSHQSWIWARRYRRAIPEVYRDYRSCRMIIADLRVGPPQQSSFLYRTVRYSSDRCGFRCFRSSPSSSQKN